MTVCVRAHACARVRLDGTAIETGGVVEVEFEEKEDIQNVMRERERGENL